METGYYTTRPRTVVAVQITAENMAEAADWCKGTIVGEGGSAFISVQAHRPQNKRQTEAHIGDYLVLQGQNFKVYLEKAFRFGFIPQGDGQPSIPHVINSREKTPIHDSLVGLPKEGAPAHVEETLTLPKSNPGDHRFVIDNNQMQNFVIDNNQMQTLDQLPPPPAEERLDTER